MPKFRVTMTRTFVGVDRCSFDIEAEDKEEAVHQMPGVPCISDRARWNDLDTGENA